MGTVIQKNAARADIEADITTTVERARRRGEAWYSGVEQHLLGAHNLIQRNLTTLAAAEKALQDAQDTASLTVAATGDRIAAEHDELYNEVGRPGLHSDPTWSLVFPHGAGTIRDLPLQEQAGATSIVVELLREHVHPLIPADVADAAALELEACAAELTAVATPLAAAKLRVALVEKTAAVLAKAGQVRLADLKRYWKSLHRSETDIHEIIPDRPRPERKPKAPATSGSSSAAAGAATGATGETAE